MLDVHGGDHVDPGREQFLDVLPALLVAAAGHIGVGQLVHQRHLGAAGQDGVQIHLGEPRAPVHHLLPEHDLQPGHQVRGPPPAVVLDERHHDVRPTLLPPVRLGEHGVRLADPGGRPEVDAQPASSHEHHS